MQVDHVHYERKLSDHDYGNRAMSASARIDEGDSPREIIMMLRDLVVERLTEDEERERADEARRQDARMALYDAERAERLKRRQTEVSGIMDVDDENDEEEVF